MKKILMVAALVSGMAIAAEAQTSLGLGARYVKTIDDLDSSFEDSGMGAVLSYKSELGDLLAAQFDLTLYPDGYAGAKQEVLSPQAFLLLGKDLYAGLGAGWLFSDGDFADSPFFIARAGVIFELLPGLHLDINANYEFPEWEGVNKIDDEVDSDTVTLGAALRIEL